MRHDPVIARAYTRITGSEPVAGNAIRLLKDAGENYPAWLEAIRSARSHIHFENYILADDAIGNTFAEALAERARAGVRVRVLYDWFGSWAYTGARYWRRLREAGVTVRAFNPPRLSSPVSWFRRDHRKVMAVDGRVGFVSGLCVAQSWLGDEAAGIKPWRDTGIALEGPVVADVERAFANSWAEAGGRIDPEDLPETGSIPAAGDMVARIIRGRPGMLNTYRIDLLAAAAARDTLWLTDAYFVATSAYVRALTEAAEDGVDVRILVPGTSDVPPAQMLARASYRPLLEAGIRVFEWNGPMLHAKTSVVDGEWARIGSTNLNVTSWLNNWELDAMIEDARFANIMQDMYLADLDNAVEVIEDDRNRVRPLAQTRPPRPRRMPLDRRRNKGSAGRLAAGAVGLGSTAGAAITHSRGLSATESRVIVRIGLFLAGLAGLFVLFPRLIAVPVALGLAWTGLAMLVRAWRLRREAGENEAGEGEGEDEPDASEESAESRAGAGEQERQVIPGRERGDGR